MIAPTFFGKKSVNKLHKKPDGIIKDTVLSFLESHLILIPDITVINVPTEEVFAWRLKKRTRENSRSGAVHDKYNSRAKEWFKETYPDQYCEGQEKWDRLLDKMDVFGWKPDNPAVIMIRRKKKCRLWDGHHRLGVAMELGIKYIPVRFKYKLKEL